MENTSLYNFLAGDILVFDYRQTNVCLSEDNFSYEIRRGRPSAYCEDYMGVNSVEELLATMLLDSFLSC